MMPKGRLTVVGTGLSAGAHMTGESLSLIMSCDHLFYVVADPATEIWLQQLNPNHSSLYSFYDSNLPRLETYHRMVEAVLAPLREGKNVCAAFYGHPGVFVFPGHEAIIRAREEGFEATMKPAVSAEDCLFADLGIDPSRVGCQSYEANDFLIFHRKIDPRSIAIIWQVGVIGQISFGPAPNLSRGIELLKEQLSLFVSLGVQAIVYEASPYVFCAPKILSMTLQELRAHHLSQISTLVIPPSEDSIIDLEMLDKLKIGQDYGRLRVAKETRYDPKRPSFDLSHALT